MKQTGAKQRALVYIGKKVSIVEATNPLLIGLKGSIVDETKFTFTIETKQGRKMIKKNEVTLRVNTAGTEGDAFDVAGRLLIGSPEERLKE